MCSMSTKKTGTIITGAAALAVTAGLAVTTVGAASAATLPTKPLPRAAYGSVELRGPLQSESFLALQGARYHGAVDYMSWTLRGARLRGLRACGRVARAVCLPIRAASTPTP